IVDCLIEEHDEADDQVVEIAAQDVNDLSFSSCGTIPQVGDSETEIVKGDESTGYEIAAGSFEHTFTVPAGIGRFRVTLNAGEDSGFNDVDLYVKFDATPVPDPFFENPDADAYSFNYGTYEALEVIAPAAGTWHVLVVEAGFSSGEPYQVTMTTFTGP
ncbi:MAG: PPC domain-containing protein, partial [Gammaproteobacteria bacterium]